MNLPLTHFRLPALAVVMMVSLLSPLAAKDLLPGVTKVPVEFSGGHDTDPQDRGRPVVLVAGGLGVTPEVFREAFSHVKPAPAGTEPDPKQVRENKAALMAALGKFGVTNDKLDAVSNHYRYVRSRGELWPVKPAVAVALVKDGKILDFEIVSGGAGYSSVPTIKVEGVKDAQAKIDLSYGKDLETNGSIAKMTLPSGAK